MTTIKGDQSKFNSAISFLESLYVGGIKLGLKTTYRMLECVNNPHQQLKFVHVGGTNGKGSVCAMLTSALTNSGLKTGLYTSPHLVSICERFRINGKPIKAAELADLVFFLKEKTQNLFNGYQDQHPTFFEFTTVLAMLYFQRENVNLAVIEVGMGGRLDCTNVITPLLSIITSIHYDHTKYLGTDLKKIAKEKAGIIKPNIPVLCGDRHDDVKNVIAFQAAKEHSEVYFIGQDFNTINYYYQKRNSLLTQTNRVCWQNSEANIITSLLGKFQCENTSIVYSALVLLKKIGVRFSLDKAKLGIQKCVWPGRLHILADQVVVDIAHNLNAINNLVATLKELYADVKWTLLFGALKEKNWQDMLQSLAPITHRFYFVELPSRRTESPLKMRDFISKHWGEKRSTMVDNVEDGLARLRSAGKGLVTGSSYLVGQILSIYNDESKLNIYDIC